MPGNEAYHRVIDFLMPQWDSPEIDVEFRNMGILGMQRTGKTTLALTIANDLKRKYDDLVTLYGYWLHQIIPAAREDGVLKEAKHVLIILDDATAFQAIDKHMLQKIQLELKYYWRIAHELKKAGVKQYTTKVVLLYLYHSYMLVSKFMRNAHLIAIKSLLPRFQQYEREDVTLKWFDALVVRELTKMRFSNDVNQVRAALSKALVYWMSGATEIMTFKAVKIPPKNFYDYTHLEIEEDEKDEDELETLRKQVKTLSKAVAKILDELNIPVKVNRKKYLLAKMNGSWKSLGPIAPYLKSS